MVTSTSIQVAPEPLVIGDIEITDNARGVMGGPQFSSRPFSSWNTRTGRKLLHTRRAGRLTPPDRTGPGVGDPAARLRWALRHQQLGRRANHLNLSSGESRGARSYQVLASGSSSSSRPTKRPRT